MAKINEVDITSLLFQEGAAPSTPASTKWRLYAKTDGFYYIDDAGSETGPLATSGGAALEPYIVEFNAAATPKSTTGVGFGTITFSTGRYLNFERGVSGSDLDQVVWPVSLGAGTYTFTMMHHKANLRPILDFALDGTLFAALSGSSSTIDQYNSSSTVAIDSITGIVVASSGTKDFRVRINGKNASSSAYTPSVTAFSFTRTA